MKLTKEWLIEQRAYDGNISWFGAQKENNATKVVLKLLKQDRFNFSNWLLVRLMNRKQRIQYAVFSAEQVIDIYEKKYPDDKRPRLAIDATKIYIKNSSKKVADDIITNATNAADYAVNYADYSVSNAAGAAVNAAKVTNNKYDQIAYTANTAACAIDAVTRAAKLAKVDFIEPNITMKKRIIEYGISLVKI